MCNVAFPGGVNETSVEEAVVVFLDQRERARLPQPIKTHTQFRHGLTGTLHGGWVKLVKTSPNTEINFTICYLASIGEFGRYEQQEIQGSDWKAPMH